MMTINLAAAAAAAAAVTLIITCSSYLQALRIINATKKYHTIVIIS